MLWGDMILPPVAPTVLAADNQSGLTLMCPATLACSFPKRIFDEVSLPVMKVPRHQRIQASGSSSQGSGDYGNHSCRIHDGGKADKADDRDERFLQLLHRMPKYGEHLFDSGTLYEPANKRAYEEKYSCMGEPRDGIV